MADRSGPEEPIRTVQNERARLTTRIVRTRAPAADRYIIWDDALAGFGCVVHPSGRRVFILNYRPRGTRAMRRLSLGAFGPMTVEQARVRARELLLEIGRGADPRAALAARRDAPTVEQLGADYLTDVEARRKARTAEGYRQLWDKHVLPALRRELVDAVSTAQVAALHRKLRETPYAANRVLSLLGSFFAYAERQGVRPPHTNPAHAIEPYQERARERYLTPAEVTRLGAALTKALGDGVPPAPRRRRKPQTGITAKHRPKSADRPRPASPFAIAAIRFLLLSGWREREALTLKWSDVDLERRIATLADTKTGKSIRALGAPAIALLEELPQIDGCPYAFPGRARKDGPPGALVEINRVWFAVRHAAGLDDVRLHDLRHSFASTVASAGGSLLMIRALLGHKDTKTTAKYAHLFEDPVKATADATAIQLSTWLTRPIDASAR